MTNEISEITKGITAKNHKLTNDQIAELSGKIQAAIKILQERWDVNSFRLNGTTVTRESLDQLFKEEPTVLIGYKARQVMIESNQALVMQQVAKNSNGYKIQADAFQEAMVGLTRACELYDASKGFRFSTYAVWWIKQCLVTHLRRDMFSMKVRPELVTLKYKVKKLVRSYFADYAKVLTMAQVAVILNQKVEDVITAVNLPKEISIHEKPGSSEEGQSHLDLLANPIDEGEETQQFYQDVIESDLPVKDLVTYFVFSGFVEKLRKGEKLSEVERREIRNHFKQK